MANDVNVKIGADFSDVTKGAEDAKKSVLELEKVTSNIVIAPEIDTKEIQDSFSELNKRAKSEFAELSKSLSDVGENVDFSDAKKKVTELKKAYEKEFKAIQKSAKQLRKEGSPAPDDAEIKSQLNQITKAFDNAFDKIQKEANKVDPFEKIAKEAKKSATKAGADAGKGFSDGFTGAFAGAAIFEVATSAISSISAQISEVTGSFQNLRLQAELTGQSFEDLQERGSNAFREGLGESIAEANEKIATSTRLLSQIEVDGKKIFTNQDQIDSFAVRAEKIGKAFDQDFNEVILKTTPALKAFGIEGGQALDLLSSAFQNTNIAQDDLLDTVAEYSTFFQDAGFSAEQFFGLLEQGSDVTGFNLDKVGDAIKEANIRLAALDTQKALQDIDAPVSQAIQALEQAARAGEITVQEFIQRSTELTEQALQEGAITDAVAKQLDVAIAGTQAEDLGQAFRDIFSIDVDEAAVAANAAKVGKAIDDNLQPQGVQALEREFEILTTTIVSDVLPALTPLIAGFTSFLQFISDNSDVLGLVAIGIGGITVALTAQSIAASASAAATGILTAAQTALNTVLSLNPIAKIVILLSTLTAAVVFAYNNFETFRNIVDGAFDVLKSVGSFILDVIVGAFEAVVFYIQLNIEAWKSIINAIVDFLDIFLPVREAFDAFVESILGVINSVGEFLGLIDETTDKTEKETKATKELTEEEKARAKALQDTTKNLKAAIAQQEQVIAAKEKEQGKTQEIIALEEKRKKVVEDETLSEVDRLKAIQDINVDIIASYNTVTNVAKESAEKRVEFEFDAAQAIRSINENTINSLNNLEKQRTDNLIKELEKRKKEVETNELLSAQERATELLKLDKQISDLQTQTRIDAIKLRAKETENAEKEAIINSLKLEELRNSEIKKLLQERNDIENDLSLSSIERANQIAEINNELLEKGLDARKVSAKEQEQIAESLANNLVTINRESQEEINSITSDNVDKKIELNRKAEQEITKITEQETKKRLEAQIKLQDTSTKEGLEQRESLQLQALQKEFEDVIGVTGALTAEQTVRYREYLDKKKQLEREFQRDIAKLEQDRSKRTRKVALQEAKEEYEDALEAAKGNADEKIEVEREYRKKIKDINDQFVNDEIDGAEKTTEFLKNIGEEYTDDYKDQTKERLEADKQEIDEQKKQLQDRFKAGLISREDFLAQNKELSEKELEAEKAFQDQRVDYAKVANDAITESFKNQLSDSSEDLNDAVADFSSLFIKFKEDAEGNIVGVGLSFENLGESILAIGEASVSAITDQFGLLVAQGVPLFEAFGKSVVNTGLQIVDQLITQNIPAIIAAFTSLLGPFGVPAAAAVIALVKAGLATAKSKANAFADGVVGVDDPSAPRGVDTIPAWLNRGETVLQTDVTNRERPLLEWLHAGNDSYDFFKDNYLPNELSKHNIDMNRDHMEMVANAHNDFVRSYNATSGYNTDVIVVNDEKEVNVNISQRQKFEHEMKTTVNGNDLDFVLKKTRRKNLKRR